MFLFFDPVCLWLHKGFYQYWCTLGKSHNFFITPTPLLTWPLPLPPPLLSIAPQPQQSHFWPWSFTHSVSWLLWNIQSFSSGNGDIKGFMRCSRTESSTTVLTDISKSNRTKKKKKMIWNAGLWLAELILFWPMALALLWAANPLRNFRCKFYSPKILPV